MSDLVAIVRTAMQVAGDESSIQAIMPVGGGCISDAQQVIADSRTYLFKYNWQPLQKMFSTEAQGLELLRQTNTIRVPEVYAYADSSDGQPGWMLQEWIEQFRGEPATGAAQLGAGLAALHRAGTENGYGLHHDNYIGLTPQENSWGSHWVDFFRGRRLLPQIALADRNGWLSMKHHGDLQRLLERLDDLLCGVERQPALLHGDLWAGNVLYDEQGQPVLIDPAVFYGDREAEPAYGEWFRCFPPALYAAYEDAWPTTPNRGDRADLYNLYHALNHLNYFGARYLGEVERILRRYVA